MNTQTSKSPFELVGEKIGRWISGQIRRSSSAASSLAGKDSLHLSGHLHEHSDTARSEFYFQRTTLVWRLLLLSLPLDILLLSVQFPSLRENYNVSAFDSLLLILLALVMATASFEMVLATRIRAQRLMKERRRLLYYFGLGLSLAIVTFLLYQFSSSLQQRLLPLLVLLITVIGGIPAFRRARRDNAKHRSRLDSDRRFWVEHFNQTLFLLRITPYFCARLLSIVAALYYSTWQIPIANYLFFAGLSAFILFSTRPKRTNFFFPCRRCAAWTSRIFEGVHGCPRCEGTFTREAQASQNTDTAHLFRFLDNVERPM